VDGHGSGSEQVDGRSADQLVGFGFGLARCDAGQRAEDFFVQGDLRRFIEEVSSAFVLDGHDRGEFGELHQAARTGESGMSACGDRYHAHGAVRADANAQVVMELLGHNLLAARDLLPIEVQEPIPFGPLTPKTAAIPATSVAVAASLPVRNRDTARNSRSGTVEGELAQLSPTGYWPLRERDTLF
jgi:hypothetical protein